MPAAVYPVTADKGVVVSRTDTLHIQNPSDISGELQQIPGLMLGDNGGLAGLKTVSLRGMGSPHTAVYIDGVKVGNVQSGQGDMDLRYSFQSAIDRTPDSYSFGQQIPYIAKHTTIADLKAAWRGYTLNPRWILKSGRSDGAGSLADWNTLDISLWKTFIFRSSYSLGINLSAKNLMDTSYELVSSYPMPGRSFIAAIEFRF